MRSSESEPTGRQRIRSFLAGGSCDRAPVLALVGELAPRVGQLDPANWLTEPELATRAVVDTARICGLDGVVLDAPAGAVAAFAPQGQPESDRELSCLRAVVMRVTALLSEEAGVLVGVAGPWRLLDVPAARDPDTSGEHHEHVDAMLGVLHHLGLASAAGVAVMEGRPPAGGNAAALGDLLAPVWAVARYYALPSLLVSSEGPAELSGVGADAVVVLAGASPAELLAAGAKRVGVPVSPDEGDLPDLPEGGFYLVRGDMAAGSDPGRVADLVGRLVGGEVQA
ncbi:MAG: hypothetical protein ACRD0B_00050 [Acidimicrobiales bacterium]